jgi:hypothetical protein
MGLSHSNAWPGTASVIIQFKTFLCMLFHGVPWLRRCSPACHIGGLCSMPDQYICYVRGEEALVQVFLGLSRFSPVIIIPSLLRAHLNVHVARTRRTNG